jgi:hypothetical protein
MEALESRQLLSTTALGAQPAAVSDTGFAVGQDFALGQTLLPTIDPLASEPLDATVLAPAIDIALYISPGDTWLAGLAALEDAIISAGFTYDIIDAGIINSDLLDGRFRAVVFPGAVDTTRFARDLSAAGRQNVRDFVAAGGGFLGIGFGAVVGAESGTFLGSDISTFSLGLAPASVFGPPAIAPLGSVVVTPVTLTGAAANHPATVGLGLTPPVRLSAIQVDGPSIVAGSVLGSASTTLATFDAIPGGGAIVANEFVDGRVVLVGPHLEIVDPLVGPSQLPLLGGLLEWVVVGDVLETRLPVARLATPASPASGNIPIEYVLSDLDSDLCNVTVDYSLDGGGTWRPATPGPGGDGTTLLESSPAGVAHTFVWDSLADLGAVRQANVLVRVRPRELGGSGRADTTSPFVVNNVAPFICVTSPDGGESWALASRQEITWLSGGAGAGSTVAIDLWRDGSFVRTVEDQAPDTGLFGWVIPDDLPVGDGYTIRITLPLANGCTLVDESDAPFSLTPVAPIEAELTAGQSYSFEDSSGDMVAATFRGPGTAELHFAQGWGIDLDRVVLSGTNRRSALVVRPLGRVARTTVGEVVVQDGSLGRLIAPRTDVVGAGISAAADDGTIGVIRVGDVVSGDILLPGGGRGVVLRAGTLSETTDIVLGSPLRSLTATTWPGASLSAPRAGVIRILGDRRAGIAGDLGADIDLSATNARGVSLGRLRVAGTASGSTVRTAGGMRTIVVGAVDGSDFLAGVRDDAVRRANVADDFVSPASIGRVRVLGLRGSDGPFFRDTNVSAERLGVVRLRDGDFVTGDSGLSATGIRRVIHRDTLTGQRWVWPPGRRQFAGPDGLVRIL